MKRDDDDLLNQWVADHLEAEAAQVNVPGLWSRLQHRLRQPTTVVEPSRPVSGGFLRRARWSMALAASLLLLILGTLNWSSSSAQAETLVRQAQAKQRLAVDRCYKIHTELFGSYREKFPILNQAGFELIHTRGDRFWVEARRQEPKGPFARPGLRWGRDESGRTWVAVSPRLGLRFEPDEVPAALDFFMAIRGADLDGIFKGLLTDFDLRFEASDEGGVRRVAAQLRSGRSHGSLKSAEISIRGGDQELEELVLHRVLLNQPFAQVHLRREPDRPQPDENYRLETHLLKNAVILERGQSARRNEIIRNLLRELQAPALEGRKA